MFFFNKQYFALTFILFCIEIFIALFVHDNFIRPYIGDLLVVILIYCFLKSFLILKNLLAVTYVLVFAFTIEFLQFLNIIEILGLEDSKLARIIIGTSFSWEDLLMYVAGGLIIIVFENYRFR